MVVKSLKISKGASRWVIKIGPLAFKFPYLTSGGSSFGIIHRFACGIKNNRVENTYSTSLDDVCPVYYSLLGLVNIVPYCKPLTLEEYEEVNYKKFVEREQYHIPAEDKPDSFGWYKGKIIAIDYA